MRDVLRCALALVVCWLAGPVTLAATVDAINPAKLDPGTEVSSEEALLVQALRQVQSGDIDDALTTLERLLVLNPSFRLAQLVYGDLLLSKGRAISGFGPRLVGQSTQLSGLKEEALQRLQYYESTPPPGDLPAELLGLSPQHKQVVIVDISGSRLYLFENHAGEPRLIGNFYVSTGKQGSKKVREGDQKTPVGVYFVTGRIGSDELPDFYGAGALPVNYPNEWDVRLGRTGYGIWIHGVPTSTYSRVPRASDGCVALANADLTQLWSHLTSEDVPVIFVEHMTWVDADELRRVGDDLRSRIGDWRRAWESRDLRRYGAFYSSDFLVESMNQARWLAHKRRVNATKTFIEVGISNLSMYGYPGESALVVVSFQQNYHSSNYNGSGLKRQYWKKETDGVWRIVYEGTVKLRPEHTRGVPYSARVNLTSIGP